MAHTVCGLILSPRLRKAPYSDHCHFNIFLCDLFQFFPDLDIANYADDNTPHSTNKNLNVLRDLEKESNNLFKWFTKNFLQVNPEKLHLLTNSTQQIQISIDGMAISNSKYEKLLCTHIDIKLAFEPRVRSRCKKASQKKTAFVRIAHSLKFGQRRLLNPFITSQFSYAPVVWMFHRRKWNNCTNRIVYQDHNSTFDKLLEKDGFFNIQNCNLQKLFIEILKVKMNLALEIMKFK